MGTRNGFATAQELRSTVFGLGPFDEFFFLFLFDDDHDGSCTGSVWGVRLGCFGGTSRFNHTLPISIGT